MTAPLTPDSLRRLLMVKGLLGEIHALTPTSDALAVARAILTAHDAAELALATLADILGARPKDPAFLMNYAGALRDKLGDLAGYGFLSSLNDERVSFKHKGNLPNVQQWHRVGVHQSTSRFESFPPAVAPHMPRDPPHHPIPRWRGEFARLGCEARRDAGAAHDMSDSRPLRPASGMIERRWERRLRCSRERARTSGTGRGDTPDRARNPSRLHTNSGCADNHCEKTSASVGGLALA